MSSTSSSDLSRLVAPLTANMGGLEFGKKVIIAQIGSPMTGSRSAMRTLDTLLQSADSVILWARDTKTYESIRDELRWNATLKFDGTPMSRH